MFGAQELGAIMLVVGIFFLSLIFIMEMPFIVHLFLLLGLIFIILTFVWINYLISYSGFQPAINKINPEKYDIWANVSKDHLLTLQVVKKGVYGQTKGIMRGHKADVIDKGDFPIRLKNGNPAILTHDLMSHNMNLKHAIAWKQIFKKEKVRSGKEAYHKAMKKSIDKEIPNA